MSTPAILEGALLAQAAGFAVHYQRGKRAFELRWSTSPPKIANELKRDYRDGYNIGFRTGTWSKLDGWPVVVLDADIRSDDPAHRAAAREAWRELVGELKPTVKTGGGGAHLYLRCPPDKLPSDQAIVLKQSQDNVGNKPSWTIELLSGGHAVTLPPSIHPSGKPYEWVNGGLAHVEAMPESLLHAVTAIRQLRPRGVAAADDAWPDPKPIIGELMPVPAFDAETLLPDVLRAWIMDEAERMPCPPDFIAAAALVALGSIVGARCAMKPKARDSWLIVPNLWGGIVGDPSAKKSPAWGAALKPLDRLIAKAVEAHTAALADYKTDKVVFDAHKDAIERRIKEAAKKPSKGDPASIAKELRTHGEQAPEAPMLRRYKTNDSTVEKLGELLRENPAGLLVLRDELVGLIATWEREGREGERAFFLEAWNGNQSFDTDRIGRGHISVPNLCASIFGGIQPDKLTAYLEQAEHALANDGMLQRFQLLVYPDPRRWEWRDRGPDKAAQDAAFAVFEKLADFDPLAWGAAPADDFAKFRHFCFDDEAQAVFIEWSKDMHRGRMPNENEPLIRQHLAKFDKLFPALALLFHLVDCAAQGIRGPVTKEAALRAAAWCEYLEAHARRCYGLLKDDGLRAAQALAAKLERAALEDGFTLREVRRNQWRSLTTDEAIHAALDWLEDEDWLRSEATGGTGPGSGRRTLRYRIHPAIKGKGKGSDA
jgi:Protein of unknown function (DUF3987)/Bifunctional DNA primase/polymerase, N-terminal